MARDWNDLLPEDGREVARTLTRVLSVMSNEVKSAKVGKSYRYGIFFTAIIDFPRNRKTPLDLPLPFVSVWRGTCCLLTLPA